MAKDCKLMLNQTRFPVIDRPQVGESAETALHDGTLVRGTVVASDDDHYFLDSIGISGYHQITANYTVTAEESRVFMVMDNSEDAISEKIELRPIPRDYVQRDPRWLHSMIREVMPFQQLLLSSDKIFAGIVSMLVDKEWRQPAVQLLEGSVQLLTTACDKASAETGLSSTPAFRMFLNKTTASVIKRIHQNTLLAMEKLVTYNQSPYTQQDEFFRQVHRYRTREASTFLKAALAATTSSGTGVLSRKEARHVIDSLLEAFQTRPVLDVVALELQNALAAYGKLALVRIADDLPMLFRSMFERVVDEMRASRSFELSDSELGLF
ncbi:hypothetical protein ACA910_008747 [Epithemia clementina (nom. ined.)]